jgi:hypothetical protein
MAARHETGLLIQKIKIYLLFLVIIKRDPFMPFNIKLQDYLKANQVIPFVGAGVSMAVRSKGSDKSPFPSWWTLLEAAAVRLDQEQKADEAKRLRAVLADNDYLNAAYCAEKGLGSGLTRIIKENVDVSRNDIEEDSLKLARRIWKLGSRVALTTNYDHVLDWACPPEAGNCQRILNTNNYELGELLNGNGNRSGVWHLHGHVDDANSLVLTPNSYARLYPDGKQKTEWEAALKTLQHTIATKSLLFIGYGLGDIQIVEQLIETANLYNGATKTHFIVATEDLKWKIEAKQLPVEVIPYKEHGEPLLALLDEMIALVPAANSSSPLAAGTNTNPSTKTAKYDPKLPSFNVPFRQKGELVLGRDEQLAKVREQLMSGTPTAIGQAASFHGMGGLGKTQLAVEYAYKFRDEYPYGVVWLTADGDIDSQLTELAESAGWIAPESEHKSKLDIALHRIRSYSECLLIFDNVEERKDIKEYLPEPSANPHIPHSTSSFYVNSTRSSRCGSEPRAVVSGSQCGTPL